MRARRERLRCRAGVAGARTGSGTAVEAGHRHVAAFCQKQPRQDPQEGGLAGAVGAEQRRNTSGADLKVDAGQDMLITERPANVASIQDSAQGVCAHRRTVRQSGQNDKRWLAARAHRAAVAAARELAELVGRANDVILVNRVAVLIRMQERVISDRAIVNHHRCNVLHGVPPSISENYEANTNILSCQLLSTPHDDGLWDVQG